MIDQPGTPAAGRTATGLTARLMGGALLGKALGFVRELMMAQVLGASIVADGFRGALTGVLLPLILLQNDCVPALLIPLHKRWGGQGRVIRRFTALTIALTLAATLIMLALEGLARQWVDVIVGGFSAEGQALTLLFIRIMALGMPASVLMNCLAAAEISHGRSRIASLRSSVQNLAVIAGILLLGLTGRLDVLAWSFTVAFNGLAAWGTFTLVRDGTLSMTGVSPAEVVSAAAEFLRGLRPLLVQPLAEQGQVWLERFLASALVTGTLASLDYARTLTESAVLLVSQPVGLAVLSAGERPDPRAQVDALARPLLGVAVPASLFLILFAPDVVQLVFARGAFNAHAVSLTSQTLRGTAFGLWAATLGWVLLRILNSAGRNGLAAVILSLAFAANAAADLLTVGVLGPFGLGSLALGLSEAMRGLVLLFGTALALRCGRRLMILLLWVVPAALLQGAAAWACDSLDPLLLRLGAGGACMLVATLVNVRLLMPGALSHWLSHGMGFARRRLGRLA